MSVLKVEENTPLWRVVIFPISAHHLFDLHRDNSFTLLGQPQKKEMKKERERVSDVEGEKRSLMPDDPLLSALITTSSCQA